MSRRGRHSRQATPSPSGAPEAGNERRQEGIAKAARRAEPASAGRRTGWRGRSRSQPAAHQRAAAEDIAEALRALRDPNNQGEAGAPQEQPQQQEDAAGASGQQSPPPAAQQEQPAPTPQDATAAQILDKERRDRAAREQLQRGTLPRTPPVEKNW